MAVIGACGQSAPDPAPAAPAPAAPAPAAPAAPVAEVAAEATITAAAAQEKPAPFRENPNFGDVTEVSVEAEGIGETPEIAVLWAIDSAISQVNGRGVSSGVDSFQARVRKSGWRWDSAKTIRADGFVQSIVSASQGAVSSFRIISQEEIQRIEAERIVTAQGLDQSTGANNATFDSTERRFADVNWKVRIEAKVAKFVAPKEQGRPKLAIVMPRYKSRSFAVGDSRIAAVDVASEIRSRLSDAITQSKRFMVLDREFAEVLEEEIAFIESGNARNEELARIGQQLAADLLLVVAIDRFEYPRNTAKLRMSDRQLVSYAGGGRIALRLINASTGEMVMSESFAHELPATAPSTLARSIDGRSLARQMTDAMTGRIIAALVNEVFPVSVIALSGDTVVLSQGGQSLSVGQRYSSVMLGQELVDPQTGNSLGRMETPCCVIRIDRVSEQTSYGVIEGDLPQLNEPFRPGMIELQDLLPAVAQLASIKSTSSDPKIATTKGAGRPSTTNAETQESPDARTSAAKKDDEW